MGAATAPPGDGNNNSKDDAATGWYEGRADPTGALLGSHKWQQINPSTYKGLVKRLKMIKEAELPPMRVISADKIRELGRIPRSTEGFQQDALEVVQHWGIDTNSWSRAVIIFFSHTWLLPNHCKEAGKDLPWGSECKTQPQPRWAMPWDWVKLTNMRSTFSSRAPCSQSQC